ncbi:MAG: hypothetical protein RLZZ206_1106, partial [Cyanobacteriota bacterium]
MIDGGRQKPNYQSTVPKVIIDNSIGDIGSRLRNKINARIL